MGTVRALWARLPLIDDRQSLPTRLGLCRSETMSEMRKLGLPADLCEAVEKEFGQVFGSLEELLIFVLRDLLRDEAHSADQAEQRLVEERLRELGYL